MKRDLAPSQCSTSHQVQKAAGLSPQRVVGSPPDQWFQSPKEATIKCEYCAQLASKSVDEDKRDRAARKAFERRISGGDVAPPKSPEAAVMSSPEASQSAECPRGEHCKAHCTCFKIPPSFPLGWSSVQSRWIILFKVYVLFFN